MRTSCVILATLFLTSTASARVNPRLKDVHKIYVDQLRNVGTEHGKTVVMAWGSSDEVREALVAALASSARFAAVKEEVKADAEIEGTAGYIKSEKDGKKFTSGFARLELIDIKSKEVLWTFQYERTPGTGGKAADRVANQFIEALLMDAQVADNP